MRTRWLWTVVAVLGLAAASVVALPATPAQSAVGDFGTDSGSGSAVVANAGTGRYKDRISWVSWGAPGTALAAKTVRTWQQVGPTTRLEVTCSLSAITGSVLAYRPGNWAPDGLTRLYRTTDTPNNLAIGLGLGNDGGTAGFTVACPTAQLATYADSSFTGSPTTTTAVTLGGLVVADAEATNNNGEYVRVTPSNGAGTTWRMIDAYGGTCGTTYNAQAYTQGGTVNQLRLTSSGECTSPDYSATAVAFAQGASSLTVSMVGSGLAAVAIGYVLGVDYGDAPAGYGVAGSVVQPTWSNVAVPTTTTAIVSAGTVQTARLATMTAPSSALGPQAFPNSTPPHSADASGDAGWVVPPATTTTADEDAFATAPTSITYYRGVTTSYSLGNVRCTSTASVKGWIDWDRNGAFDADEASATVTCPAANVTTLVFPVPADVPVGVTAGGDRTFLRIQTAMVAAQLAPTGVAATGEVEDWPVLLQVPALRVTKTANVTSMPAAPGTVVYTVTVSNVGNGPYTATNLAYVYDSYGAAFDDASYTSHSVSAGAATNSTPNRLLSWSGALAEGASATITLTMTVRTTPVDSVMTNQARVSGAAVLATAAAQAVCTPAEVTALTCATHTVYRVGMTLAKQAFLATDTAFTSPVASGTALAPGTAVVWRYTVTNTGSGAVTDVVLTDVATDARTDAGGTTTAVTSPTITCPGTPAVTPGTSVTIPTIAAGASRVCTATGTIGVP